MLDSRRVILCAALSAFACFAQEASLAGHYEGKIQAPNREISLSLDLDQKPDKTWIGHVTLTPGPRELPLANITLHAGAISFTLAGNMPNAPKFDGKYDAETKAITGTVGGEQGSAPFEVKRVGDAKVVLPTESSALTADFEGKWEGTLDTPGGNLRLVLTFSKDEKGRAATTLVSVDQGGTPIQVSSTTINGPTVKFEIKIIQGSYEGKLNDAKNEITGTWTQGPNSLPLTFRKAGTPAPAPEKK